MGKAWMSDLLENDATALSELLSTGQVSATELMSATLDRIAAVNPCLNAIVSMADPDALLAAARMADATPRKGWLHGIPMAIKDLADAAGFATTRGTPFHAGSIAAADDTMVARLRAAGAIFVGKTNTPEFGLGSHTFNPVFGPTLNPYDRSRSAGGSSGGAAVALTTRMLAVADGSDMMGSLRNPAGWNNVYGMRPSWGLIPGERDGDTFLHQLATLGPLARTPRDLAALLATQSGPDHLQPHGLPAFAPLSLGTDLRGKRIGWLGNWGGAWPMDDGLLEAGAAAICHLTDLGCFVEDLPPPFPADALWDSWITLRSWSVAASLAADMAVPGVPETIKPEAIWEYERGIAMSAMEVHRASVIRSKWFATATALFDTYDALVLPSAQVWPFPVEWRWPQTIGGMTMDTYHRWMEVVVPVSLIGLPCVCLPAGFGPTGLPHGLQLLGPHQSDGALLQLAQGWESLRSDADRRPPVV
jgi:amidase